MSCLLATGTASRVFAAYRGAVWGSGFLVRTQEIREFGVGSGGYAGDIFGSGAATMERGEARALAVEGYAAGVPEDQKTEFLLAAQMVRKKVSA
jgi:hypothetical protein